MRVFSYRLLRLVLSTLLLLLFFFLPASWGATADQKPIPTPGMVTMLNLGAKQCTPCKLMEPILSELEQEYSGRADIVFIDVWQKPADGKRFGIRVIPTQIFFTSTGEEAGRHEGFMAKETIIAELEKLGVN